MVVVRDSSLLSSLTVIAVGGATWEPLDSIGTRVDPEPLLQK